MKTVLRLAAVAIAIAGAVDPPVTRRAMRRLGVEFRLPAESDPHYARALELRTSMEKLLEPLVVVDARLTPDAVVAVADANLEGLDATRILSVPVTRETGTVILAVDAPARTIAGQRADVNVSVRGVGSAGRKSTIALEVQGSVLQTVEHTWRSNDERFDTRLSFAPPAARVYHARVRVLTEHVQQPSVADALVVATDDPLRVLAYEARPSWPVTFVRRTLEGDALFQTTSSARTSRPSATTTGEAPRALSALDPDRYDLLIVGALDELRDADLKALDQFVSRRGGALVLLPDRQLPASIRKVFDLPQFNEVLTEKPLEVRGAGTFLRASELLLTRASHAKPLATVHQGDDTRAAIVSVNRGEGRVIVSGALDAWRFRAVSPDAFGSFWRAVIADAALVAPPRLRVTVDPAIARPGDALTVSVAVRPTEFDRAASRLVLPPVSASLVDSAGGSQDIRLWPGGRVGALSAELTAPRAGRYTLSASMNGVSTTVPLLIDEEVMHPEANSAAANAYAARASGGAVSGDPTEVSRLVRAIDAGAEEQTMHPMRSGWWIVPFTSLLCAEWALRRRSGLK
jgi:hypothetical protein